MVTILYMLTSMFTLYLGLKYNPPIWRLYTLIAALITGVGIILNRLVVHLNGGYMPLDINISGDSFPDLIGTRYIWITEYTKLPLLGDVINTGISASSIGDMFILLGWMYLLVNLWLNRNAGNKTKGCKVSP